MVGVFIKKEFGQPQIETCQALVRDSTSEPWHILEQAAPASALWLERVLSVGHN